MGIGNEWSRRYYDGPFHVFAAPPDRPAISLVFVQWAQGVVERSTESHLLRTLGIMFNSLFIYGVMWVAKFMFFNKVLFAHRPMPAALEAAVDEI